MMPAGWKKRLKLTVYKWDVSFSLIFYKLTPAEYTYFKTRLQQDLESRKGLKKSQCSKGASGGEKGNHSNRRSDPPPKTINLKAKCEPKRLI